MSGRTAVAAGGFVAALATGGALVRKALREGAKALGSDPHHANRASQTLTIAAPQDELYRLFGDTSRFGHALRNVAEIRPEADGTAHWRAPDPAAPTSSGTHVSRMSARTSCCAGRR